MDIANSSDSQYTIIKNMPERSRYEQAQEDFKSGLNVKPFNQEVIQRLIIKVAEAGISVVDPITNYQTLRECQKAAAERAIQVNNQPAFREFLRAERSIEEKLRNLN